MELTQIGYAVRTARQAARMSAKELASAVALTPAALSKIETGHQNLDFKTAISIVKVLKISLDTLASLAEKVSDVSNESNAARHEFALRLKSLERSAIETALAVMHDTPYFEHNENV
jgi:transcriptional regulator with XRE-family HTH domain